MVQVTVGKWGDNLVVRLPGEIVQAVRLQDGESVELEALYDTVVIRRTAPRPSLKQLFEGRTPTEWRAAYASAYDWGPDKGREIIPE